MKFYNIKVCGLKFKENILNLSSLEIDYIGFVFYKKSKRYVGENFQIPEIPYSIKKVGVFVNESLSRVKEISNRFKLDIIQLHGDESSDYCKSLFSSQIPIIKAFGIYENFDFNMINAYSPFVDYILFDTKDTLYGGTGKRFSWDLIKKYDGDTPFFLSGGIALEHIDQLVCFRHKNLHGIDLNSKFEESPGMKNIELLSHFISTLRYEKFLIENNI